MQTNRANVVKPENWVDVVTAQVGNLRYGVVQIVVHDSRVVQIERTEKVRLTDKQESSTGVTFDER